MSTDSLENIPKIDLSGDGGVIKQILKEGTGEEKPMNGNKVDVHYTGKLLDGTVFDSSITRGEPISFPLGKGQVIKGWDMAVASMVVGEKAMLTLAPQYAYGDSGSPPTIPPKATLQFEVELMAIQNEEDVSPDSDKTIMKKVLQEGEGWKSPSDDVEVTVKISAKKSSGEVVEVESTKTIVVGDDQVSSALETCLNSMKKGERATFRISPPWVTEQTIYEIELEDLKSPPSAYELSEEEKVATASTFKAKGNTFFSKQKYDLAVKKYKKALTYVDGKFQAGSKEEAESKQLADAAHLNLAACMLKLNEPRKVFEHTKKMSKRTAKALFREGNAHEILGEYDEGKACFDEILKQEPDNAEAKRALSLLLVKKRKQEQKEKGMYAKMFA